MSDIKTTSHFGQRYKKLSSSIKKKAVEREKIFKRNPFDSRLNTHKLHGERKEEWAYSVDRSYRIIFMFLDGNQVLYTDIGTHNELY